MHGRDIVAIVELIFYIPTAFLAAFVCFKHGFAKSSGFIFTLLLCVVRIAGAVCQLVSRTNQSTGLFEAIVVFDALGLSQLLMATLGMLNRFVDFINAKRTPMLTAKHFRLLHLLVMVAVILSIAGGTNATFNLATGTVKFPTTSKVGVILYTVAYILILAVYIISVPRTSAVPSKERRVAVAVTLALPLILVRLIYSLCSVFLHNHDFGLATGNTWVFGFMSVAEEFLVVLIYVVLGFFIDKLPRVASGTPAGAAAGSYPSKQRRFMGRGQDVETGYQGGQYRQPLPPQQQGVFK